MTKPNHIYNTTVEKDRLIEMEKGIYYDIPFLDYLRINAVSHSELKRFKERSPVHYEYLIDNGIREEKAAFNDGRVYHLKVLEPENFDKNVMHEPNSIKGYEDLLPASDVKKFTENPEYIYDGRRNKKVLAIFEGQYNQKKKNNPYLIRCPYETYWKAGKIKESVMSNETIAKLFDNSKKEVTLVWYERETGIKCKGRLDLDNEDKHYFSDLKKTKSASPWDFAYDARRYNYHSQMAFYKDGAETLGHKEVKAAIIIAVEDYAPFYCHPFYIKSNSIWMQKGREWYIDAIEEYEYCLSTGDWHGYYDRKNDSFKMFELPNIWNN